MAGEHTRIGGAVVRDGRTSILGNHLDIEIDQPLAANLRAKASHAVSGVTNRTTEAGIDMKCVLGKAGIGYDIA